MRSFAWRAALKAGEPAWRPWGRGWPELVRGDSSVVFTANRAALCSGSPWTMTLILWLSIRVVVVRFRKKKSPSWHSHCKTCFNNMAFQLTDWSIPEYQPSHYIFWIHFRRCWGIQTKTSSKFDQVWHLAPASLHITLAAARSKGPARFLEIPDVAHAAQWSPKELRVRRHLQ